MEGPRTAVTVGDIQFIPWEKIAVASVTDHVDEYDMTTSYDFRRVGRFVDGPYNGADLLLAFVSVEGDPCKGEGCGAPVIVRYIRTGSEFFALPKLSDAHAPDESVGHNKAIDLRPFKQLGAASAKALDLSFPALEYPAKLVAGPRAVVQFGGESVGSFDQSELQVAFHDPTYGDVWTMKPAAPERNKQYEGCTNTNPTQEGCGNLTGYGGEDFYLLRPDGTFLTYFYRPDFNPANPKEVKWAGGPLPAETDYEYQMYSGWQGSMVTMPSLLLPSEVKETDLTPIGRVNATGDVLYGLKDKNHPLYKEFYDVYVKEFPSWANQYAEDRATARPVAYEVFLSVRPLFLWKDPFGRMTRFVNTQFALPMMVEPILYLYPGQEEKVDVKLGEEIAVTDSYPAYLGGWSVLAQPDGQLMDLSSGRRMPYLFWEGHSYILPKETKGFVVKSTEVKEFLEKELPQLGLNERETHDFVSAWASKLTESPYYFITFIDRDVIDRYYPLRIEPSPDTTIRVFMDFKPLSQLIWVEPFSSAAPPARRGFTAVEWGVVVR